MLELFLQVQRDRSRKKCGVEARRAEFECHSAYFG